jgi:hypothetical protein
MHAMYSASALPVVLLLLQQLGVKSLLSVSWRDQVLTLCVLPVFLLQVTL